MTASPIRALLLSTPAVLALMIPHAGYAAIDEQGAAAFKAVIQKHLDDRVKMSAATGAQLEIQGETVVTPKGSYYQAVLPTMKTTYQNMTYNLGHVVINGIPGQTPDEWKIAIALPSPIQFSYPDGKQVSVALGSQKASGIWNTALNYTSQFNAEYKNIKVTGTPSTRVPGPDEVISSSPFNATIQSASIHQNLVNDTTKGVWSGPATFSADGIHFDAGEGQTGDIGQISGKYSFQNVPTASFTAFAEKMKNNPALTSQAGGVVQDPTQIASILDPLISLLDQPMGSVDSDFAIKNLDLRGLKDPKTGAPIDSMKIGDLHFGLGMDFTTPQKNRHDIPFGA